jgi:HEAT repeats
MTKLERMKRQDAMRNQDESRRNRQELFRAVAGTIFSGIGELIDLIKGRPHLDAAKGMMDPNSADARRRGIVHLSNKDWGRQDPYLKRYEQIARDDPNPSVRAMAIRALNRGRDKRAIPLFLSALADRNELIRLEAAKALANVPDPSAVTPLIRHMESADENLDVRIACADALRNYHTSQVAQALVRALRDRNFGVSWQARRSLQLMTGQDYRYDTVAWLNYLTNKPLTG